MTYTETEIAIAKAFDAELRAEINAETYVEVIRRNRTPKYGCACASHDFCDANMPMLEAYKRVTGCNFPDTEEEMDVWNRAWEAWRAMTA